MQPLLDLSVYTNKKADKLKPKLHVKYLILYNII
jgi:hypothetical protein